MASLSQKSKDGSSGKLGKRIFGVKDPSWTEEEEHDVVVQERATDLRSRRRFRKGELVFSRIPTVKPPPGVNVPDITHWPGLVANITTKSAAAGNGERSPSDTVTPPQVEYEYHISLLGRYGARTGGERVRSAAQLLPLAVSPEILGGSDRWNEFNSARSEVIAADLHREYKAGKLSSADLKADALEAKWRKWVYRKDQGKWDNLVLRLGYALIIAQAIAGSWTLTDELAVLPPGTVMTGMMRHAIQARHLAIFQGAWLHGERIWIGDMVRLRTPSGRQLESGYSRRSLLFLKVKYMTFEADKSKTLSPFFYGDMYELVRTDTSSEATKKVTDDVAPSGWYYHRVTNTADEAKVGLGEVAGRAYPDLLESGSSWFGYRDSEEHGCVAAGADVIALLGVVLNITRNGVVSSSRLGGNRANSWKGSLYEIIRDAVKTAERQELEMYAGLVRRALEGPSTGQQEHMEGVEESAQSTPGSAKSTAATSGPAKSTAVKSKMPTTPAKVTMTAARESESPSSAVESAAAHAASVSSKAEVPPPSDTSRARQPASILSQPTAPVQAAAPIPSQPPAPVNAAAPIPSQQPPIDVAVNATPTSNAAAEAASVPKAAAKAAAKAAPEPNAAIKSTPAPATSVTPSASQVRPRPTFAVVLPFTPALLSDPKPLLKTIYATVQAAKGGNLSVLFSTPDSDQQLYPTLRSEGTYFRAFQKFMARVYTCIVRGQLAAKVYDADVEVHFDGEGGNWETKIPQPVTRVYKFREWPNLASHITESWPRAVQVPLNTPDMLPPESLPTPRSPTTYSVGAVGGTFDHLHAAHKFLLHMALFTARDWLVVGVNDGELLKDKSHLDLVQPLSVRMEAVKSFLNRLGQDTKIEVVEISDANRPIACEPDIEALTLTGETRFEGHVANNIRRERGMSDLDIVGLSVLGGYTAGKERFGSSLIREWLSTKKREDKIDLAGAQRTASDKL